MKKILIILGLTGILTSCSNDDVTTVETNDTKNKTVLKELSLLVGETLKNKNVRSEIVETVDEIDSYGNAVSFALLLGVNERISNFEKRKLQQLSNKHISLKSSSLFKNHLNQVYNSNKENYPELNKICVSDGSNFNRTILSELETYLIDNELELYFPYKDQFDWDNLINYTVTFEDENPEGNYEGFKFLEYSYEEVNNIIDDYLYGNPTVAIIPIDQDYLGEELRITNNNETHYLNPNLSFSEISAFYDIIYAGGNFSGGSSTGSNTGNNNTPQRIRLTQNVNPYTFFNSNHVLTEFIPKVRIKGTAWKRSLSKSHRTRIARAGSTVAVNPNGGFSAMTGTFYYDFDIKRRDLKDENWVNVGIMFDPNWHKAKGSQQIIVWTVRARTSNSNVQVKNEIKLDAQGNYTPTTSVSYNFTANSGTGAIFRGNTELDRDQVLTTVVGGSEFDNAVYNYNGVNLSVRRVANRFEYFFDHYYTNL